VVVAILLIPLQNVETAIGFVIGGVLSGLRRVHRHETSRSGPTLGSPRRLAGASRRAGHRLQGRLVTGLLVVGLALLALPATSGSADLHDLSDKECVDALVGLGFGGSLISVFAVWAAASSPRPPTSGGPGRKIEAGIPRTIRATRP